LPERLECAWLFGSQIAEASGGANRRDSLILMAMNEKTRTAFNFQPGNYASLSFLAQITVSPMQSRMGCLLLSPFSYN
jgi:hypothetical protein